MSVLLKNKILRAAAQELENRLTPENRIGYTGIVVSGMREGLHGATGILVALTLSPDPIRDCVVRAVNLAFQVRIAAGGQASFAATIAAATTLMFVALDFADRKKILRIGNVELNSAAQIFADTVLHGVGLTASVLETITSRIGAIAKDDPVKTATLRNLAEHLASQRN